MSSIVDHGTTRDGLIQLRRRWPCHGSARAAAIVVHGLAEHSGRYEHVGEQLASSGFEVVSVDNRGFGGSGGARGHVDSFAQFYDDLEDQLREVRALGLPTLLIGHSLGGLIVTGYCLSGRPVPHAVALSGPPLAVDLKPSERALRSIAPVLRRFVPRHEISDGWNAASFASDVLVGERFMSDPLRVDFVTISLASEILDEIDRVEPLLDTIDVPVWVGHGEADEIVPVRASEAFERVDSAIRKTYPGLGHEILNEPVGRDILAEIIGWAEDALSV